jgi:WD40 repeat protein
LIVPVLGLLGLIPAEAAAAEEALPNGAIARLGSTRFRHGDMVSTLSFSADGKTLATVSPGRPSGICVWNVADGTLLRQFKDKIYYSCAMSPDGCTVVLAQYQGIIQVVDVASGNEKQQFQATQELERIALSANGKTLATWAIDRQIHGPPPLSGKNIVELYDMSTGKRLRRLERQQDAAILGDINASLSSEHTEVQYLALSADGQMVASASWDKTICIWDDVGTALVRQFGGVKQPAKRFAFSADGKTLAAVCDDRKLRFIEVSTGKELGKMDWKSPRTHGLAFSPDGKTLASSEVVQEGQRWFEVVSIRKVPSGDLVAQSPFCQAWALAFAPDGKTLATSTGGGTIQFWDSATGKEVRPNHGHTGLVVGLVFAPDGKTLLSQGDDATIRWWDLKTGKQQRQIEAQPESLAGCMVFSPDGKTLAAISAHPWHVGLYDAATGKNLRRLEGHKGPSYTLAFTPDGKELASAERDGPTLVWDPATGRLLRRLDVGFQGAECAGLSRDGSRVAYVKDNRNTAIPGPFSAGIWDVGTGKSVVQFGVDTRRTPGMLRFSHDGKTLIGATYDGTVCVLDAATGKEKLHFDGGLQYGGTIAVSPDGKTLATSGAKWKENTIYVWDLATGKELGRFPANGYQLYALAFSPDGDLLASAGADTTVLVWDINRLRR